MTTHDNKEIVGRYLAEVVNGRMLDVADCILSPDFAMDRSGVAGTTKTPASFCNMMAGFTAAFPDFQVAVEEVVAERDAVAVRLGWRGTQQGEFRGMPASGRPFAVTGSAVYHVIDGRITRAWEQLDLFALIEQIGAPSTIGSTD